MLATGPIPGFNHYTYPNPIWMHVFTKSMSEKGFDGAIFIEMTEGETIIPLNSLILYNLDKIGSEEGWRKIK